MGTRTLQEYRDNVSAQLTRGTIGNALLDKWVNDSQKEVGYAFKFPELETSTAFNTVVGQYSYPLLVIASDYRFMHAEGLWIQSPSNKIGKLKRENHSKWLRNVGNLTDTTSYATPNYYHRYGKSVLFRPVPDDVVSIMLHYWRRLLKLTAPTAVTELDDEWDEIIELGALYRGYRHYREFDRYMNTRNDFLALIRSRAMEEDLEEIDQGGLNIVSSEDDLSNG